MKVVYLNTNSKILPIKNGLVLALGYFDGLHIAHQSLIKKTLETAKENHYRSGLMTFQPNPKYLLGKQKIESLLTPHHMKINLLDKMGVDYLFVVKFDLSIAKLSPRQFVEKFILALDTKHVVTGFDFLYGYKGKGNINTLFEDGKKLFGITMIDEQKINGVKISSSRIRELIVNGQVDEVKPYLGRLYTTEGIVIHGFKRGREMGYPTANISTINNYLIPQNGVYIVKVKVFQQEYYGICNIGHNPTFRENNNKSVEVHILNFDKYIYNEKITITWIKKIRDEKKFDCVENLIAQLNEDKEKAFKFINNA
ncbi:bifunctional riboflavin kinase/FAD synthetase [Mycoplasmatota bacterium]|nr:bifunctional riboflavin kinase/FAD synthetase [Mycoplasmatota bacterium]